MAERGRVSGHENLLEDPASHHSFMGIKCPRRGGLKLHYVVCTPPVSEPKTSMSPGHGLKPQLFPLLGNMGNPLTSLTLIYICKMD